MLKDSEEKAEALDDKGHKALVSDFEFLLQEARFGKFHDFHRLGFDAPKVTLVKKLELMKQRVMDGIYDN